MLAGLTQIPSGHFHSTSHALESRKPPVSPSDVIEREEGLRMGLEFIWLVLTPANPRRQGRVCRDDMRVSTGWRG